MKKTRTFSDIDLNFTPVPSAYDRYDVPVDNTGSVIITGVKESPIIVGESTLFQYMIKPNDNLYVDSIFIGKIKSIESNTQLTLFNNCITQFQIDTSSGHTFKYSTPGDIAVRFDENAIKASIKHLILTMNHERPFNSKIGSQARAMMFELATPMSGIMLKQSIINTITAFEPRVVLLEVVVNFQPESYNVNVSIYFQVINTTEPLQIDLVLTRTR
jgi:phage baseplate assembly protein W